MPTPHLRYFAARGRAQFLRNFLACRAPQFVDEQVPVSATFDDWVAMRDDESRAGPFHRLPVLHWGEELVPEALAIAQFLHRELGDEARLLRQQSIQHAALVSSLHLDVLLPLGQLIWADVIYPGIDMSKVTNTIFNRVRALLAHIDRWLEALDWHAESIGRPIMLADCLLWDQLDAVSYVFGEHARIGEFPTLAHIYAKSPGRSAFAGMLEKAPLPLTGRGLANEKEILPKLRAAISV